MGMALNHELLSLTLLVRRPALFSECRVFTILRAQMHHVDPHGDCFVHSQYSDERNCCRPIRDTNNIASYHHMDSAIVLFRSLLPNRLDFL